ncbi:MAG TPA: PelD GGDEF domain-containing protein, partial [Anaeromyxobacteraceae bacterium]|nr:PelD GGDEF domain-containing protein [Anaeromyxobacteraceae bacterium]
SRAMEDAHGRGVPACLVMVDVRAAPGQVPAGHRLAARLAAQRRLTDDAAVLLDAGARAAVALLLRFAGADGLERYRARLEQFVREDLGAGAGISIRAWLLPDSFLPRRPSQVQAFLTDLAVEGTSRTRERGSRRRHAALAVHDGARGG